MVANYEAKYHHLKFFPAADTRSVRQGSSQMACSIDSFCWLVKIAVFFGLLVVSSPSRDESTHTNNWAVIVSAYWCILISIF